MILPKQPAMKNTAHGHGDKGMYFYHYTDTEGLGINADVRRESRSHAEVSRFYYDWLPEQYFPDYGQLWLAVAILTDEQVEAEKSKYPLVRSAEPVGDRGRQNKCRLCSGLSEPKHGVLIVHLASNWRPGDDRYTELCGDHQHLVEDPRALWAALDAEVAARRARRVAKGLVP